MNVEISRNEFPGTVNRYDFLFKTKSFCPCASRSYFGRRISCSSRGEDQSNSTTMISGTIALCIGVADRIRETGGSVSDPFGSAADRGRLAKAKKIRQGRSAYEWVPGVRPGFICWRRLRRGSLPLSGSHVCAAADRGRLAKAKKNPARRAGFFEDWWA